MIDQRLLDPKTNPWTSSVQTYERKRVKQLPTELKKEERILGKDLAFDEAQKG
jgi:hypothetical protein